MSEIANVNNGLLAPVEVGTGGTSPYIQFPHPMAKNYAEFLADNKDAGPCDPYLMRSPAGAVYELKTLSFLLTPFYISYYVTELDNEGNFLQIVIDEGERRDAMQVVDAVVLVVIEETVLCPARIRAKKARAPMLSHAINMMSQDNFDINSYDKKLTTALSKVNMLYLASTFVTSHTLQTPKKGGKPYNKSTSSATKTTLATAKTAIDILSDKDDVYSPILAACVADHSATVESLKQLV